MQTAQPMRQGSSPSASARAGSPCVRSRPSSAPAARKSHRVRLITGLIIVVVAGAGLFYGVKTASNTGFLIAFFSGVAGTLALTMGRAGMTIIPGVAIATAVMPPLEIGRAHV